MDWGAHAARVRAMAPRHRELLLHTKIDNQKTVAARRDNQHARRVCSPDQIFAGSDKVRSVHPVRDTLRFFKLMRRYQKL